MEEVTPIRWQCPLCGHEMQTSAESYECTACNSLFQLVDDIPVLLRGDIDKEVQGYFDGVSDALRDDRASYVPFDAPQLDRQLRIVSAAFDRLIRRWVLPGSLVLDVGCGHGALLGKLATIYRLIGVDFAWKMLPLARRRGYRVAFASGTNLPFSADQFDAVICAEVIQQMISVDDVFAELSRVCKPGGSVVISTLNSSSLLRAIARKLSRSLRPETFPIPVVRRSPVEVIEVAARHRLRFVSIGWVLSPTGLLPLRDRAWSRLAPFATNFIVRFDKI